MTFKILVAAIGLAAASLSFAQTRSDINEHGTAYDPEPGTLFEWLEQYDWSTSELGEDRTADNRWCVESTDEIGTRDATDGIVGGGEVESFSANRCFGSGAASYCLR